MLILTALLLQFVSSHASAGASTSAGGLTWTVPKGWTEQANASTMRLATYKVAPAPGDPEGGEVGVFYFGKGQGGSIDSNVARWQGQFEPEAGAAFPKPKKIKAGTVDVTMVSAEGTYASGMPGAPATPKKGWALSGAIAEGPEGMVFFKMVGPKKTVARAAPEMEALLKSLKKG